MLTDIAQSPIAETVRRLSTERKTGDLQVRSGRMVKIAFFDHGRLVFAASNLRRDRLGEAMVADGRITEEDFNRVSALMRTDRRRFGEALVHAGVMDRYDVGTAVARQVRRVALSLFELVDGAALFDERDSAIPLEYMVSLSIHRLLYDGIRSMKSEELVVKGLGHLDRGVMLAEVPPFSFERRGRSAEELELLDLAQRRVTIRRLAWSGSGLAFTRLRSVYALLAAGLLREADVQAPAPQPVMQTETGMFLLSALQNRPDPSLRDAIRREVQQELEHSAKLDREAWLKLARAAPRDEMVRALEEKMERYHALRDGLSADDAIRNDIDVILGRASGAMRLARSAPETANAEAVLKRHAAEAAAAVQRATRPPAVLVPQPVAPAVSTPAAAAAAPPRPDASGDGLGGPTPPYGTPIPPATAKPAPAASAPRRERAPTASAPPTLPQHPVDQPQVPQAARPLSPAEQSIPPGKRPDDSQLSVAPGASGFEGRAQIEHLLMEGEVRMTVADYANAVKVYDKLVRVAPQVAAFHLRLAVAMACYPRTAKMAEREFYEAARLEPDNADVHYQWGLYYKVMKIKSRAVAEMRTAVRLNPKHKGARAELEQLSPKDSALTSLKKLFR
jgi:tetratricopeptide (TPR) repeat protein